jgi:ribosylpyrimidine nucleosidase
MSDAKNPSSESGLASSLPASWWKWTAEQDRQLIESCKPGSQVLPPKAGDGSDRKCLLAPECPHITHFVQRSKTASSPGPSKLWIDCDPGHDDAMALILALQNSAVDIIGVSLVAGNQSLSKVVQNACNILSVSGCRDQLDFPIVAGSGTPLMRPELDHADVHCEDIHGESGLDGTVFPPAVIQEHKSEKAVNCMYRSIVEADEPVTLIVTGPMTNIALLLLVYPEVRPCIRSVVFMGGAIGSGNTGPAAEFNIEMDPHAANVVLQSGLDVVMIPIEVSHKVLVDPHVRSRIASMATPYSKMICDLLDFFAGSYKKFFGFDYPPLHDPLTVAYVINPTIFETRLMRVDIDTDSVLCYGRTVCDVYGKSAKPVNTRVACSVDVDAFWDMMLSAVSSANTVSSLNQPHRSKL